MRRARACVTGMGVVSPVGVGVGAFFDSLVGGRNAAAPVRSFGTGGLPVRVGCEAPEAGLPPALRPHCLGGRCTELALLAAAQAVEAAGLAGRIQGRDDVAVVVGTTMGDVSEFERRREANADRAADLEELRLLADRPLDVMGRSIASLFALSRPVVTVPTACAAGAYAVGMAASLVRRGSAGIALAVGCEAFSRLAFLGFLRLGAMSVDLCRPFSGGRRGLLLGEGAAALVVESEVSARARGAEVLGFVDGFGLSCDAHHVTGPHPDGEGAARAMTDALERAGVRAEEVDYVNAHGTGTAQNDAMESRAIRRVFDGAGRVPPVSSIKSLTGHMMGAAGAAEAVATLLALVRGVVPPTWNWLGPDPDCPVDCVPNEPRALPLRRALSNSYAFGGNNASLLLSSPEVAA